MIDSRLHHGALPTGSPQATAKINVVVGGDSGLDFLFSSDPKQTAEKKRLENAVYRSLDEIHAGTPIQCVLVADCNRQVEAFTYRWAARNKVNVRFFRQDWRKHGKGAAAAAGKAMLRARVGPKMLLMFVREEVSPTSQSLIRRAEEAGIKVVVKEA